MPDEWPKDAPLDRIAAALGIGGYVRHMFLCVHGDCAPQALECGFPSVFGALLFASRLRAGVGVEVPLPRLVCIVEPPRTLGGCRLAPARRLTVLCRP